MDIQINGKTVAVEKLPLKKYSDLLTALQALPKHFESLDQISNEDLLPLVKTLVDEAYPDVVRVLKVATPLTDEDIESMGLPDLIDVIEAVVKVNRFADVYEKIKKLGTRPQTVIEGSSTGSTGQ